MDTLENYRDAGSDLRDYYATAICNRMNEIMKVLTIISTIFMPLSFIAGVYGMNFDADARSMPSWLEVRLPVVAGVDGGGGDRAAVSTSGARAGSAADAAADEPTDDEATARRRLYPRSADDPPASLLDA